MRKLGTVLLMVVTVLFVGGTMAPAIAQEAPAQAPAQAPEQAPQVAAEVAVPQAAPVQAAPQVPEQAPQVAEPPVAPEQEVDYSWGTVVQATAEGITVEQYNYETEGYDQVSYTVASDISLENIAAITDLKAGDEVEVGFVIKDEKKVAVSLYLEVLEDLEGDSGEEE